MNALILILVIWMVYGVEAAGCVVIFPQKSSSSLAPSTINIVDVPQEEQGLVAGKAKIEFGRIGYRSRDVVFIRERLPAFDGGIWKRALSVWRYGGEFAAAQWKPHSNVNLKDLCSGVANVCNYILRTRNVVYAPALGDTKGHPPNDKSRAMGGKERGLSDSGALAGIAPELEREVSKSAGNESENTSEDGDPPIGLGPPVMRRFLFAIFCFFVGCVLATRSVRTYADNNRRASRRFGWFALALYSAGVGLWLCNMVPATWGWWL